MKRTTVITFDIVQYRPRPFPQSSILEKAIEESKVDQEGRFNLGTYGISILLLKIQIIQKSPWFVQLIDKDQERSISLPSVRKIDFYSLDFIFDFFIDNHRRNVASIVLQSISQDSKASPIQNPLKVIIKMIRWKIFKRYSLEISYLFQ